MKTFTRIMESLTAGLFLLLCLAILAAGIGLLVSLAWHLFLLGWEAGGKFLH